ncbi:hypothetical protein GQR58_016100 [Nymphon striatum]|nr:hypothetical protein GQR58_016100 [Nymphon striatum]
MIIYKSGRNSFRIVYIALVKTNSEGGIARPLRLHDATPSVLSFGWDSSLVGALKNQCLMASYCERYFSNEKNPFLKFCIPGLKEVQGGPLTPVPLTLSRTDGTMMTMSHGTKSDLFKYLESRVAEHGSPTKVKSTIIDGNFLMHCLPPTYGRLVNFFATCNPVVPLQTYGWMLALLVRIAGATLTSLKLQPRLRLCKALPGIHVFTACDYTSFCIRKGKKRPLKIAEENYSFLDAFAALATVQVDRATCEALEEYTSKLYGAKQTLPLNKHRYQVFAKSYGLKRGKNPFARLKGADASNIPPCENVVLQKIHRNNFVAMTWHAACNSNIPK